MHTVQYLPQLAGWHKTITKIITLGLATPGKRHIIMFFTLFLYLNRHAILFLGRDMFMSVIDVQILHTYALFYIA